MNNLNTWKYLQANNYFANHNCYKNFQLAKEDSKLIEKIQDKVVVEIGCGYGRETYYFSKYVKEIYAIDVSNEILDLTKQTIIKFGKIWNVEYILAEEYKYLIKNPIDFVYSKHVFQHITPEFAKDYLSHFLYLLTPDGEIDILFRIGNRKDYPINQEPLVEYTLSELGNLFEGYNILDVIKEKGKNYDLWRVKANVT